MKKLFLLITLIAFAALSVAQVYQCVWSKGKVLYAVSTEEFDSISYEWIDNVDYSRMSILNTQNLRNQAPNTDTIYIYDTVVVAVPKENLSAYAYAAFSIGGNKKIIFSKGNLQYHPADQKWRFAEHQTDFIGGTNYQISTTYNGWLDLFGWSASGSKNYGLSTSTYSYGSSYSGSFVDWGSNQIGEDAPNTWRTLFDYEWNYILYYRANASSLRGVAQVIGINGLILLPDNWVCPEGMTFKSGSHYNNGTQYYPAYQSFTAEEWARMEAAGAVFLPAAGYRYGADVRGVQQEGYYWAATGYDDDESYGLYIYSSGMSLNDRYRYNGYSVRLAKDL